MAEAVRLYLAIEPSRASLTVRILRYEIEKGLRAVYIEPCKIGCPKKTKVRILFCNKTHWFS